jgi:hypothetical protein
MSTKNRQADGLSECVISELRDTPPESKTAVRGSRKAGVRLTAVEARNNHDPDEYIAGMLRRRALRDSRRSEIKKHILQLKPLLNQSHSQSHFPQSSHEHMHPHSHSPHPPHSDSQSHSTSCSHSCASSSKSSITSTSILNLPKRMNFSR